MEANMHESSVMADRSLLGETHDLPHVGMGVGVGVGIGEAEVHLEEDGDVDVEAHGGIEDAGEGEIDGQGDGDGEAEEHEHDYALDPLDEITTAEIISASIRANVAAQEAEERARAMTMAAASGQEAASGSGSGIGVGQGIAYPGHHMLTGAMVDGSTQDEKDLPSVPLHMVNINTLSDTHTHTPPGDPSNYSLGTLDPHAHADLSALSGSSTSAEASGSGTGENNHADMLALYGRPLRDDTTPHPEMIDFNSKAEFEIWLEGELAWCHYIQRRITNPQKRAAERAKARDQKYYKAVYDLTPEERADLPIPLRRKRARTSTVAQKITYTCHHAGTYTSKHSDRVPEGKQRMNTKKSVKCGCTSRIVVNEMESGLVHAAYHWRHVGHDPFASDEMESSRLPRVVDEWVVNQINAGKSPEEIRRMLTVSDEVKAEYLRRETENPDTLDPSIPPSLAWAVKIKYADIYNRYRKLHGTIRSSIQTPGDENGIGVGDDGGAADGVTPGADVNHAHALEAVDEEADEKASTGATPPPVSANLYDASAPVSAMSAVDQSCVGPNAMTMGMGVGAGIGAAMDGVNMGVDPISFAPVNNGVIDWHLSDEDDEEDQEVQNAHLQTDQAHLSSDMDAIDPIFRPASSPVMRLQGEGGEQINLVQPVFTLSAGAKRSYAAEGKGSEGQQHASEDTHAHKRSRVTSATALTGSNAGSLAGAQSRGMTPATISTSGVGVGVGVGVSATSQIQRANHDAHTDSTPSAAETMSAIHAAVAASSTDTHARKQHQSVQQPSAHDAPIQSDVADTAEEMETETETADAFGLESYFGDQAAMSELQMLANEIREHWRQ